MRLTSLRIWGSGVRISSGAPVTHCVDSSFGIVPTFCFHFRPIPVSFSEPNADAAYGSCPLWVKSRRVRRTSSCPLYPKKRHQMRHMECPLWVIGGYFALDCFHRWSPTCATLYAFIFYVCALMAMLVSGA